MIRVHSRNLTLVEQCHCRAISSSNATCVLDGDIVSVNATSDNSNTTMCLGDGAQNLDAACLQAYGGAVGLRNATLTAQLASAYSDLHASCMLQEDEVRYLPTSAR